MRYFYEAHCSEALIVSIIMVAFISLLSLLNLLVSSSEADLVAFPLPGVKRNLLSQSDHLDLIRRSVPLLENRTLTVCVVVREPFVIYNGLSMSRSAPTGNGTANGTGPMAMRQQQQEQDEAEAVAAAMSDLNNYSGVAIEVVRRLSVIFRFNIRIVRPRDNQFGVLSADKGWTGLMGLLVRGECDIGTTALSITVTRANWVDFTRAYYVETGTILLRTPGETQNYSAIFEPFSLTVWIVLVATILILITLITVMTKLEEKQREQHRLFKLAKFLAKRKASTLSPAAPADTLIHTGPSQSSSSSNASSLAASSPTRTNRTSHPSHEDRQYLEQLERRLAAIEEARHKQEFGSTWLERFYYATSCVLNILLIRGEYFKSTFNRIDVLSSKVCCLCGLRAFCAGSFRVRFHWLYGEQPASLNKKADQEGGREPAKRGKEARADERR